MKTVAAVAAFCMLSIACVAQPTPAMAEGKSALNKATLEAYVRHLLLWNDQIGVKVSDPKPAPMPGYKEFVVTGSYNKVSLDEVFYVSNDGKKIVRGTVYDVTKSPFAEQLGKLETASAPSTGTPGAPVSLVVFSDFECSYCKQEAKVLRENLTKTFPKEVQLYFKDMPLDQIHPWARLASIAGRCVYREQPAAFWDYHDWIFEKQGDITPDNLKTKIGEWAQSRFMDVKKLAACVDARATEADVNKSVEEARALKVQSTPTIFVNGRMLTGSVAWPQLKAIIDWEIDHAKRTAVEAEKCCELTLPVPGAK